MDRSQASKGPILSSPTFTPATELDFRFYLDSVGRSKLTAVILVDSEGRIVYADKLGHELFEGSLNNFDSLKIQNLMLLSKKELYLKQLQNLQEGKEVVADWIIYSKNTKRRYNYIPIDELNEINAQEIYFRFLKMLSLRIKPVKVSLPNNKDIKGYWNRTLISEGEDEER